MKTEWTDERTRRLLYLRDDEHWTFPAIARDLGTSVTNVQRKYQKLRPEKVEPQRRWSEAENQTLLRRADAGERFETIARDLYRTRWACIIQHKVLKARAPASLAGRRPSVRTVREGYRFLAEEARSAPALRYASPYGELLGEPPIGRSALDKKNGGPQP
jgi:hypothetical protein